MTTSQPQLDVASAPDIRTVSDARQFVSHVIRNDLGDRLFDAREVLSQWPSLLPYESAVLDLVYEEYARRAASGEEIDAHAFAARYPELQTSVLEHIQAHELLEKCFEGAPIWPREDESFHGFEILSEIGRGAFSRVYLARETEIGLRPVVIKVCHSRTHEAHVLGQLEHPAIVGVHSVIQDAARQLYALVMPYLGRVTLEHVIDDCRRGRRVTTAREVFDTVRRLNDDDPDAPAANPRFGSYETCVVRLMADVASALEFAHARGVRHSDVKPSNVLVTPELRAKLLDFNLSQESGAEVSLAGGTLPYMAPEQLIAVVAGKQPASTIASDVYAFGLTLCEAVTGRRPYESIPANLSRTALAEWLLVHREQAIDPGLIENRGLRTLIQQCVTASVPDRPASMGLVAARLNAECRAVVRMRRWCERHPRRAAGIAIACAVAFSAASAGYHYYPWHQHHLRAARSEFAGNDFARCIICAQRVIADPRAHDDHALVAEAQWLLAWSQARLGDFDAAVSGLRAADQLAQNDPQILAASGYCLALTGNYDDAAMSFHAALDQGLDTPIVVFDLGQCQMLNGSFVAAAETFNAGVRTWPDDPNLLAALGMIRCIETNALASERVGKRPQHVIDSKAVDSVVAQFDPTDILQAKAHGAHGLLFEYTAARSYVWLAAKEPEKRLSHLQTAANHWQAALHLGASGSMHGNLVQDYKFAIGGEVDTVSFPKSTQVTAPTFLLEPVDPGDGP